MAHVGLGQRRAHGIDARPFYGMEYILRRREHENDHADEEDGGAAELHGGSIAEPIAAVDLPLPDLDHEPPLPPSGPLEVLLAGAFADILRRPDGVSVEDDFFIDLGGDSLSAALLVTLVWLAGRYEASVVQGNLERDAADAVGDVRAGLTRNVQSLQALQAG